jgi:hypothetical protein
MTSLLLSNGGVIAAERWHSLVLVLVINITAVE